MLVNLRLVSLTIFVVIYNTLQSCNGEGNKSQVETGQFHPLKWNPIFPRGYFKRSIGIEGNGDSSSSDGFYDYFYHEVEEPECPEEEFFHIRGRKCVPFDCPGGNQYRNKYTGECLLKRYGIMEDSKQKQQRPGNRFQKQNKFRLPFGLTLKG